MDGCWRSPVVSVVVGVLAGVAPALRAARAAIADAIRDGGHGATTGKRRRGLLGTFVRVEIALAVVLLASAGLLLKSFARLAAVDPGFRADGLLTFSVQLPRTRYPNRAALFTFHERLAERLTRVPGVRAAGAVNVLPFSQGNWCTDIEPEVALAAPASDRECVEIGAVTGNYFNAIGVRLIEGRVLASTDMETSPLVAVISELTAKRYWPGRSAVGQRFAFDDKTSIEVVGVVSPVRLFALDRDPVPQLYMPLRQLVQQQMTIAVRTDGDPRALVRPTRDLVRELDPDLYLDGMRTMNDLVAESMATPRLRSVVLGSFAAVAFLLAIVGVYGVMAFAVSQRTREIGIRAALGATRQVILREVLGDGARLAAVGVVGGVAGALGLTRVLSKVLFGVSAYDPIVFAGAALGLIVVALGACWIPARRAASVDPVMVVRQP
jgi:putative ABC transport system permease protein